MAELNRAVALGSRYGLRAIGMYCDSTVETPQMDESAMEGAVGIVITVAAVVIALYITAIVTASMSKTVSGGGFYSNGTPISATGGMGLSNAWNQSIYGMDTNANSSFTLAGILPIAVVGVGILTIIIAAFAMR